MRKENYFELRAKKVSFILILAIGLLSIILALTPMDLFISSIISFSVGESFDRLMIIFDKISTPFIAAFALAIIYLTNRKWFKRSALGLLIASAAVVLLKITIMRPRPYLEGINIPSEIINASFSTWNWSFPSSHAAIPFLIIPFLNGKTKIIWAIFAVVIAFSRIYLGLHYLSDVLFGASLGLAVAFVLKKSKDI